MTRSVRPIGRAVALMALLMLVAGPVVRVASAGSARHLAATSIGQDTQACPVLLGCGADVQAATDLETRIQDNLHYGLTLPIDYRTPERILGDVADISGAWADAGLWSSTYLAAESYRYALARKALQSGQGEYAGEDRDFWAAQKQQATERIDVLLAQIDLRTNIATEWKLEPSLPTSNQPTQLPPGADAGTGLAQGTPGMLMYSCGPVDAPPGFGMGHNDNVYGPWHWTNPDHRPARLTLPQVDYQCETSTTRDNYAGTLFGMLTAFDLVGPDDPQVRALIRDDLLRIADFLLAHGWSYARPSGRVALPPSGDLESNFVTPLMVISPTYRLGVSQAALHVADVAGPTAEAVKWQAVYAEEFASQVPGDSVSDEVNDPSPTAGYYGWNLAHLMYFNLVRLARNPAERLAYRTDFSVVDRQTADDVNAFFEAVAFTMTGEPTRRDEAVLHLRQWRDYRAKLDAGATVDNTSRCGTQIRCVPEDQYDLVFDTPAGEHRITVPGQSTTLRAEDPLPVADRRPTDFLWQRSPFDAMDGSVAATHQEPGIDYLLPYWMLRYYTEIDPPAYDPIPQWPGPAYSGT